MSSVEKTTWCIRTARRLVPARLSLLLAWLVASPLCSNADNDITALTTESPAPVEFAVLEDVSGRLDLTAVMERPAGYWRTAPPGTVLRTAPRSIWWLRLHLVNSRPAAQPAWLEIAPPRLPWLDLYVVGNDGSIERHLTGLQRPFANRPRPLRQFVQPLELPAGASLTLYLRTQSPSIGVTPVSLRLWKPAAFATAVQAENLLYGALIGLIAGFAAYHLVLFRASGERPFLHFATYLGLLAIVTIERSGLGAQYLWADWPWLDRPLEAILPCLFFGSLTLVVTALLDSRHRAPCLHRILLRVAALLAVPAALAVAELLGLRTPVRLASYGLQGLSAVLTVLYLVTGITLWRRGLPAAGMLFAAWACGAVALAIDQVASESLPAPGPFGFEFWSALQATLLGLYLGDRSYRLKQEELAAERRRLEAETQHAAQLKAQVQNRTLELEKALHRIKLLARTDELTQLNNLRAFTELLPREFARARRERQLLAFALLDIDRLKPYNEHYGHQAGDLLLRQIAEILRAWLRRPGDYAFRLSGEQFGILLAQAASRERCIRLIEHLRQEIVARALPHIGNEPGIVTCSIGLAFNLDLIEPSPDALRRAVDEALMAAKAKGRNRIEIAGATDPAELGPSTEAIDADRSAGQQ